MTHETQIDVRSHKSSPINLLTKMVFNLPGAQETPLMSSVLCCTPQELETSPLSSAGATGSWDNLDVQQPEQRKMRWYTKPRSNVLCPLMCFYQNYMKSNLISTQMIFSVRTASLSAQVLDFNSAVLSYMYLSLHRFILLPYPFYLIALVTVVIKGAYSGFQVTAAQGLLAAKEPGYDFVWKWCTV